MSAPENVDLTDNIVAELGRLFLLVEALQASNLSLQVQVETLTERMAVLEKEQTRLHANEAEPALGLRLNQPQQL